MEFSSVVIVAQISLSFIRRFSPFWSFGHVVAAFPPIYPYGAKFRFAFYACISLFVLPLEPVGNVLLRSPLSGFVCTKVHWETQDRVRSPTHGEVHGARLWTPGYKATVACSWVWTIRREK